MGCARLVMGAFVLLPSTKSWTAAAAAFDPKDFLVRGLEDIEPAFGSFDGTMHAGLLPFDVPPDRVRGKFMFWLFEPRRTAVPGSLSIYISGGPYCSSIGTGALFEHAPITVPLFPAGMVDPTDKDGEFVPNPHSWAAATNMLYIEQPAGTGFSYGPKPADEDEVARDLYNFLVNFLSTFERLKGKDLYVWGGSYSGMMVPSVARKIHRENERNKARGQGMHINLAGIGLGNAWLDPNIQGPAVIDFAWSHGMIDSTARDTFHDYWKDCKQGLPLVPPMHPFTTSDECGLDEIVMQAAGEGLFGDEMAPNVYDITTWDPYNVISNDGTINKFYNNPAVQKVLHARRVASRSVEWYGCVDSSTQEGPFLEHDRPESVVPYVAELLDEAGIRVLFYNGDRDLICCHTGTEMLLDSMRWSKASEWGSARRGVWMVDDRVAGYTKSLGNLEFVVVYNSGHMVPYNQPVRSLDMVKRFLKGETLLDVELPSYPKSHQKKKNGKNATKHAYWVLALVAVMFVATFFIRRRYKDRKQSYEEVPSNGVGLALE